MTTAVRFLVSGQVQGVFYRASAADRASALGLSGFVRNLEDGRVELVASGGAEAIGRLAEWLWEGPPRARVAGVELEAWADAVEAGFRIEP